MCIVREDVKSILSYVDYSRLCNVILSFPALSPIFLTNGITFLCQIVKEPQKGEFLLMV